MLPEPMDRVPNATRPNAYPKPMLIQSRATLLIQSLGRVVLDHRDTNRIRRGNCYAQLPKQRKKMAEKKMLHHINKINK